MTKKVHVYYWLVFLVFATTGACAAGLDSRCLQSFADADRVVAYQNQSLSCKHLELARGDLFSAITEQSSSNELPLAAANLAVSRMLRTFISEHKNIGSGDAASIVASNALASAGLVSCAGTAGAGCALALVAKAHAIMETARTAKSVNEKRAALAQLMEIVKLLEETEAIASEIVTDYEELVADFNRQCAITLDLCL